jgi:predicted RNase H-like HicB family nuclease
MEGLYYRTWRSTRYTLGVKVYEYTAVVEFDEEAQMYVGYVPSVPGAHTEAANLEELKVNLEEVVSLMLEVMEENGEPIRHDSVVGFQRVTVEL